MKHNIDKKGLSRRQAITQTTMGVAAGVTLLDMYKNMLPLELRKAIELGSNEALAAGPASRKNPIIQICLIDKTQQALFLETPGAIESATIPGLDGVITPANGMTAAVTAMYKGVSVSGEAQAFVNYRGRADMNMTQLFGGRLADMAAGYNLAILPKLDGQAGGNHNLNGSGINDTIGGLNSAVQDAGADAGNLLGFVGFNYSANANNARESARGINGTPLPTYEGPNSLRETLKNAVAPLSASDKALSFRKKLDALAVKNSGVLKTLLQIKEKVEPAVEGLRLAMTGEKDIVERQLEAVIAIHKAGLGNNFMIAIPWRDTNGNGNIAAPGGGENLSPFSAAAMLANLYVRISKELPNAITLTVSDGGRTNNNGDAGTGICIISGPSSFVSDGVFGTRATNANLGSDGGIAGNGSTYTMTTGGALGSLNHSHVISLVLKMINVKSDIAAPVGISPKVA